MPWQRCWRLCAAHCKQRLLQRPHIAVNVQGPHGLAEWCARACDAASGCTAVSRDAFRRTCTLHGIEPLGVAERSTWEVRKRACMQACAHVWMCAHRCFAQVTAADGSEGVVCMRKRHYTAVRSALPIHRARAGTRIHAAHLQDAQR